MNKEEFIKDFSDKGHRADPQYGRRETGAFKGIPRWGLAKVQEYFDAVACDCGAPECESWKMHIKGMEPPPDCGKDPMTWKLPFGPPFTMLDPEQPALTLTSSDDTWKRLADVTPEWGQLVEYRGENWRKEPDKTYSAIDETPRQGKFVPDCGTHWTKMLGGFTTEKLGVIVAPDPEITFWRAVPIPIGEAESPSFSFTDPPSGMTGSPDSGLASKEPIGLRGADFPFHWSFILDGKTVGELTFNEKTEKLELSGDADATAKILFDLVTDQFEVWHKEKYGE